MMSATIDSLGTILGIWAHPDDEAFTSSGIMSQAVKQGQRVVCITATKGEAGSLDENRWPSNQMGGIRNKELINSLNILGVKEHHWLNYYDGKCAEVPFEKAVDRILQIIKNVKPTSILTFGPDGMTGHLDHITVSNWATNAYQTYANPDAKLFYATTTPEWAKRFVPIINKFNVYAPGTPTTTKVSDLAINFELPNDILELKIQAIKAHVSQVTIMLDTFGQDFFKERQAKETFKLAKL